MCTFYISLYTVLAYITNYNNDYKWINTNSENIIIYSYNTKLDLFLILKWELSDSYVGVVYTGFGECYESLITHHLFVYT